MFYDRVKFLYSCFRQYRRQKDNSWHPLFNLSTYSLISGGPEYQVQDLLCFLFYLANTLSRWHHFLSAPSGSAILKYYFKKCRGSFSAAYKVTHQPFVFFNFSGFMINKIFQKYSICLTNSKLKAFSALLTWKIEYL